MSFRVRSRDERGAILPYVGGMIIVLIIFTSIVFDYGVQLVGRNQVQNAADAAAHAAAVSLSFVNPTDQNLARSAAVVAAEANQIWGGTPAMLSTNITFPPCPPGSPGAGVTGSTCVRAEVFRTNYQGASGSPLPTFFASVVGVNDQGVRGTATAEILRGAGTADCVKPVAVPDKWVELNPGPAAWHPVNSAFSRYEMNGNNAGAVLTPADEYYPPTSGSAGSGFTVETDYGTQLILKNSSPQNAIDPGWFYPVRIDPTCVGGNCYRDAWAGCSGVSIGPGDVLNPEPGNMIGPTAQGVDDLIALDPSATWSTSANGGRGGPVGGCMAAGTCARSPRWIAIPIFDVDQYQYARATGGGGAQVPINIIKILGFWLENRQGNDIYGRIMFYPTTSVLDTNNYTPSALAATQIVLVR